MFKRLCDSLDWIGRLLTIKELIILLGGSGIMTTIISNLIPFIKSMSPVSQIFLDLGIFLLLTSLMMFVWVRIRTKSLRDIPNILYKMNKRLTALVEKQTRERPIQPEAIGDDYIEIFVDESMGSELQKELASASNPKIAHDILGKWFDNFVQKASKDIDLENAMSSFLVRLNGLMNSKGIGTLKATNNDSEYIKLAKQLEQLRPQITETLDTAINNYIERLYGWNSLYISLSPLSSIFTDNIMPAKMRAEYGAFRQLMDKDMNGLLAKVTSIVQNLPSENRSDKNVRR